MAVKTRITTTQSILVSFDNPEKAKKNHVVKIRGSSNVACVKGCVLSRHITTPDSGAG